MQTHINSAIADVFEWSMSYQLLEISQDKISEESTFHLFSGRQAYFTMSSLSYYSDIIITIILFAQ